MGEDRLGLMKEIVREAKAVGLSPRDRRELVIEKVASADLSQEQAGVKNTAINKYWETKNLDSPLPVLIVVGHHKQPGQGELFTLLRDKYPQRNPEEINASITNWLAAPDDKKPHKVGSPDDPAYPLYRSIYAARQVNESYTKAMAGKIADGESAKLAQIIAKKAGCLPTPTASNGLINQEVWVKMKSLSKLRSIPLPAVRLGTLCWKNWQKPAVSTGSHSRHGRPQNC